MLVSAVRVCDAPGDRDPCFQLHVGDDRRSVLLCRDKFRNPEESFRFTADAVVDQSCSQEEIFQQFALPAIDEALRGLVGTIVLYGSSGSGKRFLFEGDGSRDGAGLLHRTFSCILNAVHVQEGTGAGSLIPELVGISAVECHSENLSDLLRDMSGDSDGPKSKRPPLRFRKDPKMGMVIDGASRLQVGSVEEAVRIFGSIKKHVKRSAHIFLGAHVGLRPPSQQDIRAEGTVLFCILAGPDTCKDTASGLWLTHLDHVLTDLENARPSVPFHKSKVSMCLQECFTGQRQCSFLCTVSTTRDSLISGCGTLALATRVMSLGARLRSLKPDPPSPGHDPVMELQRSTWVLSSGGGSDEPRLSSSYTPPSQSAGTRQPSDATWGFHDSSVAGPSQQHHHTDGSFTIRSVDDIVKQVTEGTAPPAPHQGKPPLPATFRNQGDTAPTTNTSSSANGGGLGAAIPRNNYVQVQPPSPAQQYQSEFSDSSRGGSSTRRFSAEEEGEGSMGNSTSGRQRHRAPTPLSVSSLGSANFPPRATSPTPRAASGMLARTSSAASLSQVSLLRERAFVAPGVPRTPNEFSASSLSTTSRGAGSTSRGTAGGTGGNVSQQPRGNARGGGGSLSSPPPASALQAGEVGGAVGHRLSLLEETCREQETENRRLRQELQRLQRFQAGEGRNSAGEAPLGVSFLESPGGKFRHGVSAGGAPLPDSYAFPSETYQYATQGDHTSSSSGFVWSTASHVKAKSGDAALMAAREKIKKLKGKIAEYKRYREVVDNTLKKLKLEADTTQEERNILLEENETLRKKMNVQNRQLSAAQRESRTKEQELDSLRSSVQQIRQHVAKERSELSQQCKELQRRVDALNEEVRDVQADRDDKAQQLRTAQSQIQSLESSLKHQLNSASSGGRLSASTLGGGVGGGAPLSSVKDSEVVPRFVSALDVLREHVLFPQQVSQLDAVIQELGLSVFQTSSTSSSGQRKSTSRSIVIEDS